MLKAEKRREKEPIYPLRYIRIFFQEESSNGNYFAKTANESLKN